LRGGVELSHSFSFGWTKKFAKHAQRRFLRILGLHPHGGSNNVNFLLPYFPTSLLPSKRTYSLKFPISLFPFTLLPSKKPAFTLAEVLITIGIIGVVAALTVPSLIQNYQKKQTVEQLKVAKAVVEQGFKKVIADEGVTSLADTEFVSMFTNNYYLFATKAQQDLFKKYFKVSMFVTPNKKSEMFTNLYHSNYLKTRNWYMPQVFLANGVGVLFYGFTKTPQQSQYCEQVKAQGGAYCTTMCTEWQCLRLDTNGLKGPNLPGVDLFNFIVTEDGTLYPAFDKNWSLFNTGNPEASFYYYGKYMNNIYNAAAAMIINEGWQIKYDFTAAKNKSY
jgi:prepilin-type N-terminal cleavage/methylation domain-containing protein